MTPWSAFLPDVLPFVPGTSEPMAEHAIRRAAQEFCRLTRVWRVELPAITTAAADLSYPLALTDTTLVRLESAMLDAEPLAVWRDGDAESVGRFAYTNDGQSVVLSFDPGAGRQLSLVVTVQPSHTAAGLDDFLHGMYAEVIAHGAIARIGGDPVKQGMFEQECATINARVWKGLAATRPRARPMYF